MDVPDCSVDLVCIDPIYNNVQYRELSDYFYVWQRRALRDLYGYFRRRLTNKGDEAVANPAGRLCRRPPVIPAVNGRNFY